MSLRDWISRARRVARDVDVEIRAHVDERTARPIAR